MSENKQRFLLWWSLALMVAYCLALIFLLKMFPPPSPTWSAAQVQDFYNDNELSIRLGAVVASWTGAFLVPFYIVMGIQAARVERGLPVWGIVIGLGGGLMSIFLVLPPIFWGVAAFDPGRSADTTVLMHKLGCLTLVSTDQYFVFVWVAIAALCFMKTDARHSAFPRWFGYVTGWSLLIFEAGAICFWAKTGPFAWDGLLAFWVPFAGFGVWMAMAYTLLFRALRDQREEARATEADPNQPGSQRELDGVDRAGSSV